MIAGGTAATVGGQDRAAQVVALQVAQHAVLALGYLLPLEVAGLSGSPTMMAHLGLFLLDVAG